MRVIKSEAVKAKMLCSTELDGNCYHWSLVWLFDFLFKRKVFQYKKQQDAVLSHISPHVTGYMQKHVVYIHFTVVFVWCRFLIFFALSFSEIINNVWAKADGKPFSSLSNEISPNVWHKSLQGFLIIQVQMAYGTLCEHVWNFKHGDQREYVFISWFYTNAFLYLYSSIVAAHWLSKLYFRKDN